MFLAQSINLVVGKLDSNHGVSINFNYKKVICSERPSKVSWMGGEYCMFFFTLDDFGELVISFEFLGYKFRSW